MVKQRKERIGGEFIGFGAFASADPQESAPTVSWAPVYMGNNDDFRSLFQRIAQKRDRTTLTKALQDVQGLFQSIDIPKKVQAEALQHWAWLYHTKVGAVESNASVRAAAFQTWAVAIDRLPKAVGNLVEKYPDLLGMILAAQTDPSSEVRAVAYKEQPIFQSSKWPWQEGLLEYTHRILSYGRPSTMDESLFPKQAGEPDREVTEERFNRLVGNALDALTQWIMEHGTQKDEALWWKYLVSSKPPLRLKSYNLLSAVASSKAPITMAGLKKRLPELVASEKEPANIICLLETILSVLVHSDDSIVDPLLVKALIKLFRKGCHKAPADRWGPIVLPLVAKLGKSVELLKAVHDGIPAVRSDTDKWSAWTAVCETALLCNEQTLWESGLHAALHTIESHRSAIDARTKLFNILAQHVANKTLGVSSFLTCPDVLLTEFVENLSQQTTKRVYPELRQRGWEIVEKSKDSGPSREEYGLLQSVLRYPGNSAFFEKEDTLVDFVTKDLMGWTIVHAKESSNNALINQDFELLILCLDQESVQTRCWGPFLAGLVASQCQLSNLIKGISIILQAEEDIPWLQSESLDEFALDLGRQSLVTEFQSEEETLYSDQLSFFQMCFENRKYPLLQKSTLAALIKFVSGPDSTEQSTERSSLLESLLVACERDGDFVDSLSRQEIVLASWRCVHSPLFHLYGTGLVAGNDDDGRLSFISTASSELRDSIETTHTSRQLESLWVDRACALLTFAHEKAERLPLIGLESMELWSERTPDMFRLLMLLFESWEEVSQRWELIRTWFPANPAAAFVDFLLLLSEAGSSELSNYRAMQRKDRCALLLTKIGPNPIGEDSLSRMAHAALDGIPSVIDDEVVFEKRLGVVSQIFDFLFPPLLSGMEFLLKSEKIEEGDELQYLQDATNPKSAVPARVAKVHYDAQAGYYFTVKISGEDGEQERQTVLGRLRRADYSLALNGRTFADDVPADQLAKRKVFRERIISELILPHRSKVATHRCLGELISVTIGHLGLGASRGIGSPHYDLHQCILEAECKARLLFEERDIAGFDVCLQSLSLALGFGRCAPGSTTEMKLEPVSLMQLLLDSDTPQTPRTAMATLSWLVVSLRLLTGGHQNEYIVGLQRRALVALFQSSSYLLSLEGTQTQIEHVIAYRALAQALESLALLKIPEDKELNESKKISFQLFVKTFLENDDAGDSHADLNLEMLDNLFDHLCTTENAFILTESVESVVEGLRHTRKRSTCFALLRALASRKQRLYKTEDLTLSTLTSANLKRWASGLEDEDIEIEEDIYTVAEWIPRKMMEELEVWHFSSFVDLDNDAIIGRFLLWLILLEFVDAGTPTEFRVRPAFVSYLSKSGAVSEILNLCVVYSETIGRGSSFSRDQDMPNELDDVNLLATTSLFRAVEVFPSLAKRWWEEECPKASVSPVQTFVERNVTLEILKSELLRMKRSSSFETMAVSGSTVSREIVATYQQDDFNLKVVILVPTCFPLRSAEVDCSKTLGIPPSRWKRWSLQIRLMLNNQGGTLHDALILWKDNVDREFEGVEPCPVCYSVLHVKTHKLPTLECTTCHHRFHFDCLTQWFRSSGKNQCVLCQQQWHGTRV